MVGGEYGSEGKGHISSYLAPEYDVLVRVGGPNAGHKVFEDPEPYTHHQLPSGTRCSKARLVIGPGAVLSVPGLLKEIAECRVDASRLSIDPQAMIIEESDRKREARTLVQTIGSTGQGVGYARFGRLRYKRTRAEQKQILIEQGCEFFKGTECKHRFVGIFGDRRIKKILRRALRWEVMEYPKREPSSEDRVRVVDLDPLPKTFAVSASR